MRAALCLALIALSAFAVANTEDVDAEESFELDSEMEADLESAQQQQLGAMASVAHAEFLRVAALAKAYARLSMEERQIARIVAEEYAGDVGRLRIGQLTRRQQSELIPLGMSYNYQLNVQLAHAARLFSGSEDGAAMASFLEADAEVDATTGVMSEAALDSLLNAMDEHTLNAFIELKQTVLESAIESALSGAEFEIRSERWPDFIDNAAKWVGDKASEAGNAIKDTAVNAYNTVKNADIHDISGKVGEFAGKVKDVADTVSKFSGPIAKLTAPIPYVGAAARAVDTAANAVSMGAGIVKTGADLIHDNTKPGETVGHALGRAKDAVVDAGKKAMDYAKNPGKLVDDVKKAAGDCVANPSACMDKAAKAASTVAKLAGKEDLADKIDKANDMGQKALETLGIEDKKDKDAEKKGDDKEKPETPEKPEKPEGGDKKPDGGDKPEKPEGGEKPEKPEGGEKPEKPEGGDKKDGKGEKPEGGEKPEKPEGGDKKDGKGEKPEGGDKDGDRKGRGDRGDRKERGERGDRGDRRGDRKDRGDRQERGGR